MSKYTTIIVLAIWIIVLPFLGFPSLWRTIMFVLDGFIIIMYTLLIRRETSNNPPFSFDRNGKNTDVYSENRIDNDKEEVQ